MIRVAKKNFEFHQQGCYRNNVRVSSVNANLQSFIKKATRAGVYLATDVTFKGRSKVKRSWMPLPTMKQLSECREMDHSDHREKRDPLNAGVFYDTSVPSDQNKLQANMLENFLNKLDAVTTDIIRLPTEMENGTLKARGAMYNKNIRSFENFQEKELLAIDLLLDYIFTREAGKDSGNTMYSGISQSILCQPILQVRKMACRESGDVLEMSCKESGNLLKYVCRWISDNIVKNTMQDGRRDTRSFLAAKDNARTFVSQPFAKRNITPSLIKDIEINLGRYPEGLLGVAAFSENRKKKETRRLSKINIYGNNFSYSSDVKDKQLDITSIDKSSPRVLIVSPMNVLPPRRNVIDSQFEVYELSNARSSSDNICSIVTDTSNEKDENEKTFACAEPFPTSLWLCDTEICRKLSIMESQRWIKRTESKLKSDKHIHRNLIMDNLVYIGLRWMLMPLSVLSIFYSHVRRKSCKLFTSHFSNAELIRPHLEAPQIDYDSNSRCLLCRKVYSLRNRGIGGINDFTRIRCAHMHFAFHLIYRTFIGELIEKDLQSLNCESEKSRTASETKRYI